MSKRLMGNQGLVGSMKCAEADMNYPASQRCPWMGAQHQFTQLTVHLFCLDS
jgi:hypothetical protein